MTRVEVIRFARRELADGAEGIDVMICLECCEGFTPREAEDIVETARHDAATGEPMP